jgi:hypothetical protein
MADLLVCLAMANTEPYVQAALIAENVLLESDGVASAIRITDTFTVAVPTALPAGMKPAITLNMLVTLKSGDVKGPSEVELVVHTPSGKVESLGSRPIVLEGGIHGASMKGTVNLLGIELGKPYWIDVMWGVSGGQKKRLTSMPFQFIAEKQTGGETSS